jgi:hypothetical protein
MADTGIIESPRSAVAEAALPQPAGGVAGRQVVPLLRTLVFVGGFSSIGVELTASRLVAPYFGSSTFIWATLARLRPGRTSRRPAARTNAPL